MFGRQPRRGQARQHQPRQRELRAQALELFALHHEAGGAVPVGGVERGAHLVEGAREVKIHGQWVPVNAKVESLPGMSAHADRDELIRWLSALKRPPRRLFAVHGEAESAAAFADYIREKLGWSVHLPTYRETVTLE